MIAEFFDSKKTQIIGIFGSPQPIEYVPYQDEVLADDPRYHAWWDSLLAGTITENLPVPIN